MLSVSHRFKTSIDPILPSPSGRGAGGEGKTLLHSPLLSPHPTPVPEGEGASM